MGPFILQLIFLPGKTKDFHLILEVKEFGQDRLGIGSITLSDSRRAEGPFDDRWRGGEAVRTEKLLDEPGHETNGIISFSGLRGYYVSFGSPDHQFCPSCRSCLSPVA